MEYWRFISIVISLLDRNNFPTNFSSCSLNKGGEKKKREEKVDRLDTTKGKRDQSVEFIQGRIYRLAWLTADPSFTLTIFVLRRGILL